MNPKRLQKEIDFLLGMYPNLKGLSVSHSGRKVTVMIETADGLSEYSYEEDYDRTFEDDAQPP